MTVYTKLVIDGITYTTEKSMRVEKAISDYDVTSNFFVNFKNPHGIYDDTFNLNDEVIIYADINVNPPTTKIFTGIIESIDYEGEEVNEVISLSGRDYGAILQDIIVKSRIFKDKEVSEIVLAIMSQNVSNSLITTTNVNTTSTTLDKITLQNMSVFDALSQLAEISGFYFYVDENKDLNFKVSEGVSSGLTFNNTNIRYANFTTTDDDIYNRVTVYGDRVLSGHEQYFATNGGSEFVLNYKPYNASVYVSGTTNTIQQPGGVLNMDDPKHDNVKYLVDFQGAKIIMTSGIVAGNNIPTSGTNNRLFIRYNKATPIISIKPDLESQIKYGLKDKVIIDNKIKDPKEASIKALTFLNEHKNPVIEGNINVKGIVDVTPGETAIVNDLYHNINNEVYTILSATYKFTKEKCLAEEVLNITLNKKIVDFTDTTKDILLRLKQLEVGQIEASVVNLQTDLGSVGISGPWYAKRIGIGSAFYFHVPLHNVLNSAKSLLGDMRVGSITYSGGF